MSRVPRILALIAVSLVVAALTQSYLRVQERALSAEIAANVDGLKTAQMGYHTINGRYVACSVGGSVEQEPGCSEVLGWWPLGAEVRGLYWVEVLPGEQDFKVWGMLPRGGDPILYTATATQTTKRQR